MMPAPGAPGAYAYPQTSAPQAAPAPGALQYQQSAPPGAPPPREDIAAYTAWYWAYMDYYYPQEVRVGPIALGLDIESEDSLLDLPTQARNVHENDLCLCSQAMRMRHQYAVSQGQAAQGGPQGQYAAQPYQQVQAQGASVQPYAQQPPATVPSPYPPGTSQAPPAQNWQGQQGAQHPGYQAPPSNASFGYTNNAHGPRPPSSAPSPPPAPTASSKWAWAQQVQFACVCFPSSPRL